VARASYEVRCPSCDAPYVAPRQDVGEAMVNCRCGYSGMQPTKKKSKGGGKKRTALGKRLAALWGGAVGKVCANCGRKQDYAAGVFIEGHHVVRQRLIEDKAKEEGWSQEKLDRTLWDERNRMDLCRDCHLGKHHNGSPLPWSLVERVTPGAVQFADELRLLRRIRREYVDAE
jgi:hypothetical protein